MILPSASWQRQRGPCLFHCGDELTKVEPETLPQRRSRVQEEDVNASVAAAAAKSLQSCPTLCDPIDGSPPGSPVPGILQARALEWAAISFSNEWKRKWSPLVVSDSSRPHGLQPTRLLHPRDLPGKSTGVGCHCLLLLQLLDGTKRWKFLGQVQGKGLGGWDNDHLFMSWF